METAKAPHPNSAARGSNTTFDIDSVRNDFPILRQRVHDKPLVYLDNAATTQKPQSVISAIVDYYTQYNSNVHRGIHTLSQQATNAAEHARTIVQHFLNAPEEREIIFVRGCTEAMNLVAHSYGQHHVQAGDEIIISAEEHHSNIVPWQMLCEAKHATLRVIPINDAGEILLDEYERLLGPCTKLVSVVHVSNTLGTVNPIKQMVAMAHKHHVPVFVDGAQAVAHFPVDVQDLDADFYTFSGHKLYAPTGIGVLYGKAHLLEAMPPYHGGGAMIRLVSFEKTTYNDLPFKFEAGTPHIEGVIALGKAIEYVWGLGWENIERHEQELLEYATERLLSIDGLRIVGTAAHKAGVVSFALGDIHPHDVGTILDNEGIAIRTGHHCTQPLMERFNVPALNRASFALYNTKEEIDALVQGLHKVISLFG
jgi:cysteine desulfurase/selenocysteine lyase